MQLPPNSRLFTMDVISMYMKINTDIAFIKMSTWMDMVEPEQTDLNHAAIAALKIIMNNNMFRFRDIYIQ